MVDTLPATRSVWLVAGREFGSLARSRRVVLGTVSMAVLLVAFLSWQAFAPGRQQHEVRIGLAGQAISLQQSLPQEMAALGAHVSVRAVDSVGDGVAQVRAGRLDVLVSGARPALRVTVDDDLDPRLRATLNSQVRQQILDAQIAQLGARPDQVLAKVDQAQITVTQLGGPDPGSGTHPTLGVLTALLVAWSVFAFGALVAARVRADVRDGTAEALLPVLRPRRLLAGTLGGIALTGLVHAAALGVLGLIVGLATGLAPGTGAVVVAVPAGLVGFVLGFALYGCATAAVAALRGRSETVVVTALGVVIGAVLVAGAVVFAVDPAGAGVAVLSVLPPFAPLLMPARLAAGVAAGWQVLLAAALVLLCAAALAWFAGRVYPRAVVGA